MHQASVGPLSHFSQSHFAQVKVSTVSITVRFVLMRLHWILSFPWCHLPYFSRSFQIHGIFLFLSVTDWKQETILFVNPTASGIFRLSTCPLDFACKLEPILFWAHHFLVVPFQMQQIAASSHQHSGSVPPFPMPQVH